MALSKLAKGTGWDEMYLGAPQSRQDRAQATQPHPDTLALYQRQIRDLEAELEAANGYIRSLESRCAMQARQLGYG